MTCSSCNLYKLKHYGVHSSVHSWIQDFLLGRTEAAVANGEQSDCINPDLGVPQGSFLGTCLFLYFINFCAENTHTTILSLSHTHWQWHTTDSCFTFYFVAVLLLHLSSLLLICITNTVFFKSPVSFIAIITNPITVILSLSVMQWFTSIKISWERSINIGCLNAHSPVAIKLKKTQ